MHEVIAMGWADAAGEAVGEGGEGVVGLHWDMARYKAVDESFPEAFEVLLEVVESHHDTLRVGMLAQIFPEKEHAGIGYGYVVHPRVRCKKCFQLFGDASWISGVYENGVNPALREMVFDIVGKAVAPGAVRVGPPGRVAQNPHHRNLFRYGSVRKEVGP